MNIEYKNKIFIYENNKSFEYNLLFSKIKDKNIEENESKIKSILDIYFNKKYLNCQYSKKLELYVENFLKDFI